MRLCLLLLLALATASAQETYTEVTVSVPVQACLLNTTLCMQPSCAVCAVPTPAINHTVSFIRNGRIISVMIPLLSVNVPNDALLDSLRLTNVIPVEMRRTDETEVAQYVGIGCDGGATYNIVGKISLMPGTGDLEIARALSDYTTRSWAVSGTACGTLSSTIMTWFL